MKKILIFSLILNFCLFLLWRKSTSDMLLVRKMYQDIDKNRVADFKILEALLIDHINKDMTIKTFNEKFKPNDYFFKPSERGIGIGSMFLVFDEIDKFKKLEIHSFEEK